MVIGWTLAALVILDSALGAVSGMPADPRVEPTSLQRYFDYGRSIEGKLHALVKPDDAHSGPIVLAGWIDSGCNRTVPRRAGITGISIFGNSFSGQLAQTLRKLDSSVSVEEFLGPGAPPSHSYSCFSKENSFGGDSDEIQIMGITAGSLPRMVQIWGVTTSFEFPQPFTFPRYRLGPDGELLAHEPSVRSPDDLRRVLANSAQWNAWIAEVQQQDYFYSSGLTEADPADKSVIGRMIRRGFGQGISRRRTAGLRGDDGKINAPDIVTVLPKLIGSFAKLARNSHKRPVIVLFEEYGSGGTLMPLVGSALAQDHIEFISSADIVPPVNLGNYASDGHFSPEANEKIARALLGLIHGPVAKIAGEMPRGQQ
jgi:hypothetical protein